MSKVVLSQYMSVDGYDVSVYNLDLPEGWGSWTDEGKVYYLETQKAASNEFIVRKVFDCDPWESTITID